MKINGRNRGSLTLNVNKKVFGYFLSNDLRIEVPMKFDFEFPENECCDESEIDKRFKRVLDRYRFQPVSFHDRMEQTENELNSYKRKLRE